MDQHLAISLEITKDNFKFQLALPVGASWDTTDVVMQEFLVALAEMRKIDHERADAQKEQ